jgi:sulfate adenylyltransferase
MSVIEHEAIKGTHLAGSIPHGGHLVNRIVSGEEAQELRARAVKLPLVCLSARQASDLLLIGNGAFSPLQGFMGQADYERVVTEMRLSTGLPWSLPVTLAVNDLDARAVGTPIALYGPTPEGGDKPLLGIMDVEERFRYDKSREAREVYRTEDAAHPGVSALYGQGDTLFSGSVRVFEQRDAPRYQLTPRETRAAFAERGWRTIVGFQTRNPVHRAHEYIQKCALEIVDGLLLHPLVGETKSDDIPADVRIRCYEVLLEHYYAANRTLLATLPAAMRYAGPREAISHALVRKNYGCTHFIVGRDHAGVGNYYGTYDAQRLFDEFAFGELGITPLKFENSFFCRVCAGMASDKTCPHDEAERVTLSGTRVRDLLRAGELPPPESSRPEVARILAEAMRGDATT